jgi:TM2 domain-containing membrane protein YozV
MNPVCPYCNAEIGSDPAGRIFCTSCGAAHHAECWEENRGCTVFGCSAAPPEEPKLTVGPADFQFSPAAPPPPPRVYPPPAPGVSLRPAPPPMVPRERPLSLGGYNPPPLPVWTPALPGYAAPPKSRVAYILLGIFLGIFGAHNFYAGYTARGVIQLCITICTLFVGAIISWIWAIVEVCIVDRDSQNVYMV